MAVELAAGGAVRADLGHPDDDLGTLLDGLGALVVVEVGAGVAGSTTLIRMAGNALAYWVLTSSPP